MSRFQAPTLAHLKDLSDRFNNQCSDEELKAYQAVITRNLLDYSKLWDMEDEEDNPHNGWYRRCAVRDADASDGPLSGVSVALKDNVCLAGVPMMNGSRALEGFVPHRDAAVVRSILAAGGEIAGKARCEDLCLSGGSWVTAGGAAVRNPWDGRFSAGGSSSGSAVLVAAGNVHVAVGGDQGGSIRMPSACCGIVGLKPTWGLVPYSGIVPIEASLDHAGPMARTVEDCARLLEVIAGFDDARDPRQPSTGFQVPKYTEELKLPLPQSLKIGLLKEGFENCDSVIVGAVMAAVELLRPAFEVLEVSAPLHRSAGPIWAGIGVPGLEEQLMSGAAASAQDWRLTEHMRSGLETEAPSLSHNVKSLRLTAAHLHDSGTGPALRAKAQGAAVRLRAAYDEALGAVDVLLLPTLTRLPPLIPDDRTPLDGSALYLSESSVLLKEQELYNLAWNAFEKAIQRSLGQKANCCGFNVSHHPALSLNAGFAGPDGLPVGISLVAKGWQDSLLLRVAAEVERRLASLQTRSL